MKGVSHKIRDSHFRVNNLFRLSESLLSLRSKAYLIHQSMVSVRSDTWRRHAVHGSNAELRGHQGCQLVIRKTSDLIGVMWRHPIHGQATEMGRQHVRRQAVMIRTPSIHGHLPKRRNNFQIETVHSDFMNVDLTYMARETSRLLVGVATIAHGWMVQVFELFVVRHRFVVRLFFMRRFFATTSR